MLRVMTFNLRFENDFDGDNHWLRRRDFLVQTILRYRPQVLGTQEGRPSQLAFLSKSLAGYRLAAIGRCWDDYCQYPSLYYRQEHFTLADGGEFWLSKTPEVHLSKDWDSAYPRLFSYALLETRARGRQIWFAVTHLDHVSQLARIEGARIIRDWAAVRRAPVVLLGDFNDVPGSQVHDILTGPRGPFIDTWEVLGLDEDQSSFTQHGFTGVPAKGRIDWILTSTEFKVMAAGVGRDNQAGRYPSDHFPYWSDLELDRGRPDGGVSAEKSGRAGPRVV